MTMEGVQAGIRARGAQPPPGAAEREPLISIRDRATVQVSWN